MHFLWLWIPPSLHILQYVWHFLSVLIYQLVASYDPSFSKFGSFKAGIEKGIMTESSAQPSEIFEWQDHSGIRDCNLSRVISSPFTPTMNTTTHVIKQSKEFPSDVQDGCRMRTLSDSVRYQTDVWPRSEPKQGPRPVVLLIHGAWHTPAHYYPLLHALTVAGFLTLCPQLPTCNNIVPPPYSLADDVGMVREVALDLADRGHPIIALMHSYGGVVGTEALAGLGWHARRKYRPNDSEEVEHPVGGVVALVYMASFLLPVGFSLATPFGGKLPPFMTEYPDGTCSMKDPYIRFFSADTNSEQAKSPKEFSMQESPSCLSSSLLIAHLTNHPTAAQTTVITRAAYLDTDMSTIYIICEKDLALVPEAQRSIVDMARGNGVHVYQETCQGGHSAFLSVPGEIVTIVQRAWGRWAGEEQDLDAVAVRGDVKRNAIALKDAERGEDGAKFPPRTESLADGNSAELTAMPETATTNPTDTKGFEAPANGTISQENPGIKNIAI